MPFKNLKSADVVRRQLRDLGRKINHDLQQTFTSKKIIDDLELKPSIINQQSVVYDFTCDLCDANYIGYTCRHLHQRVEEHKHLHALVLLHFCNSHTSVPVYICVTHVNSFTAFDNDDMKS